MILLIAYSAKITNKKSNQSTDDELPHHQAPHMDREQLLQAARNARGASIDHALPKEFISSCSAGQQFESRSASYENALLTF